MEVSSLVHVEHPKIRLGKQYDGGYVICDIPNIQYDLLLSGGIKDDISFEESFLAKYPSVDCLAFDGTIEDIPPTKYPIQFVKKNIGVRSTNETTNLKEYMLGKNNIFMKMDIEGYEKDLFTSLNDQDIQKFAQIVIELHKSQIQQFVYSKLKDTHYAVHYHVNNCCGVETPTIPSIIEITFIRKDLCSVVKPYSEPIPNPRFDMPNLNYKPDIQYKNGVFVNQSVTYKYDIRKRRSIAVPI